MNWEVISEVCVAEWRGADRADRSCSRIERWGARHGGSESVDVNVF